MYRNYAGSCTTLEQQKIAGSDVSDCTQQELSYELQ